MPDVPRLRRKLVFQVIAVFGACCLVANATVPSGWHLAGSTPADYEAGVDTHALYNDHSSAYLRAKNPASEGFGTLMKDFRADQP